MAKERVLIAVKTYPVLSTSHIELSCTAGFREDGSWIRIYPVPYRLMDGEKKFEKYQWIELDLKRNTKDPRPESHNPSNIDAIALKEKISPSGEWGERRRLILERNEIHTNMAALIDRSKKTNLSLAIFKPAEILDFKIEQAEEKDWNPERVKTIENLLKQDNLFDERDKSDFQLIKKLPYKFSYKIRDDSGAESTMMIEDWEIGQLYWNCLKKDSAANAVKKVRQKYFDDHAKTKDLYLFLGTTREWHGRAPNPFIIIGTFYPPFVTQQRLL